MILTQVNNQIKSRYGDKTNIYFINHSLEIGNILIAKHP